MSNLIFKKTTIYRTPITINFQAKGRQQAEKKMKERSKLKLKVEGIIKSLYYTNNARSDIPV